MGDAGAAGLRDLKARGGIVVAQDEASSVVFGMPRCAIELGIVDEVLPAAQISEAIQASVFRTTRNARNERPPADRRG
jgi:two-component system chemotaxis response regulator CheB